MCQVEKPLFALTSIAMQCIVTVQNIKNCVLQLQESKLWCPDHPLHALLGQSEAVGPREAEEEEEGEEGEAEGDHLGCA